MTAACGGGGSRPKAASPAVSIFSGLALQSLAEAVIGVSSPWIAILVAVAQYTVTAIDLCASDPPAWPVINGAEALEWVTLGPASSSSTFGKIGALIENLVWTTLCECVSGSPSGLPNPTTYPSDGPSSQQPGNGQIPISSTTPCKRMSSTNPWDYTSTGGFVVQFDFAGDTAPTDPPSAHGATSVVLSLINHAKTGAGVTIHFTLKCIDRSSAAIGTPVTFIVAPGATAIETLNIAPNTYLVELDETSTTGSGTSELYDPATSTTGYHADFYCNGDVPGGGVTPCCPPDTIAQSTLAQIQGMLTLLQRYILPFAYQLGAAHSGLSDKGSFAVSRLLGIKVELTTIPPSYGLSEGEPDFHFQVGWMSMMTGDGVIQEQKISFQTQVWQPPLFAQALTFGYSLNPGLVATFTELEAEGA